MRGGGKKKKKKRLCCVKRRKNTILYKVEALSKQRAHTIKGNAHTPTQTQTHTCRQVFLSFFLFSLVKIEQGWRCTQAAATAAGSAGVHAEQLDALRAPVEPDPRVEHQRPHVGDEEIFRLVFLHILELEFWELLFRQTEGEREGENGQI